jgi:CheY-like chemotaxis protein
MNKTILLVEDEEDDIFFMKRAVKKHGLNPLQVAQDGQAAIEYLEGIGEYANRERFPLPCLVLLDLKLPRVMGLEVLKWIRQQAALHGIVVIVLSSSKLGPDIEMAYRLGANSYLVKPSPDKLSGMISAIKQYWLDLNEPAAECLEYAERATSNNWRSASG